MIHTLERFLEWGGVKKAVTCLVFSGIALLVSIFDLLPQLPFDAAWAAVVLCGIPIILEAVIGLVTAFDIKADVLVSIALIASLIIGEDFAAGEVAFIMQLGALLEDLTVARARAGIEKLVHLTPQTARRLTGGREEAIPAEQVAVGDVLRVLPGETVPVDGEILTGQTSINQAVMTGESLPVDKGPGDEVSSGTVNQFGAFEMRATKVGEDSSIQRMIRLVQSADAGKARIVGLADRWATWIVVAALTAAALTGLITRDPIRAVTILVVFCPCALVLATPTAIMAAIGQATKHGVIIKSGEALEKMGKVDTIAFDRTGTLTYGKLEVSDVLSFAPDLDEEKLLYLAASAEVDGCQLLCGNEKYLHECGVSVTANAAGTLEKLRLQGKASILVAVNGQCVGVIALSDVLRSEASAMVQKLTAMQTNTVLLTGDNQKTADYFAAQVGIREVYADLLPEDKVGNIAALQKHGRNVCMIGDGVNDAPALKTASVGVAMGSMGSDIAVEAADIALMSDDISKIPYLKRLSGATVKTIKLSITLSMCINFLAVTLSVLGLLNPTTGALVHNAGSCFVVLIAALLYDRKFE